MTDTEVGRIVSIIDADDSKLIAKLTSAEGRARAAKLDRTAEIDADLSKLDAQVARAESRLNAIKQFKADKMALGVDTSALDGAISRAESQLAHLQGKRAQAIIDADISKLIGEVGTAEGSLSTLAGKTAECKISGDSSDLMAEIARAEGELATLAGKGVKIPISADLSGLTSQISNSLSSSMGGLGNYAGLLGGMGLAGGAVLGGAALGYTAYNQAASWQERGTSISRTTGLEGPDLENFKNDLQDIRMEMGLTQQGAADMAEAAGSIGVGQKYAGVDNAKYTQEIEDFIKANTMISGAWGTSEGETATSVGKMGSVVLESWNKQRSALGETEMSYADFALKVGGSIDTLGNAMGSTEAEIITSMKHVSSSVSQFSPNEEDYGKWTALSSYLIETGMSADHAGESIKDAMMYANRDNKGAVSSLLGVDSATLKSQMDQDAVGTMQSIAQAISAIPPSQRPDLYELFGGTGGEMVTKLVADIDSGVNRMDFAIEIGVKGFKEGDIQKGWDKVLADANTQASRLGQVFQVALEEIGTQALPIVSGAMSTVADWGIAAINAGSEVYGAVAGGVENLQAGAEGNALADVTWGDTEYEVGLFGIREKVADATQTGAAEGVAAGVQKGAAEGAPAAAKAVTEAFKGSWDDAIKDLSKTVSKELIPLTQAGFKFDASTIEAGGRWVKNNKGEDVWQPDGLTAYNSQYGNSPADEVSTTPLGTFLGSEFSTTTRSTTQGVYVDLIMDGKTIDPGEFQYYLEDSGTDAAEKVADAYYSQFKGSIVNVGNFMEDHYDKLGSRVGEIFADGVYTEAEKAENDAYLAFLDMLEEDHPIEFQAAGMDEIRQEILSLGAEEVTITFKSAWEDWTSAAYREKFLADNPEMSATLTPAQGQEWNNQMGRLGDLAEEGDARAQEALDSYGYVMDSWADGTISSIGEMSEAINLLLAYDPSLGKAGSPLRAQMDAYKDTVDTGRPEYVGGKYYPYGYDWQDTNSKYYGMWNTPADQDLQITGGEVQVPGTEDVKTNTGDTADNTAKTAGSTAEAAGSSAETASNTSSLIAPAAATQLATAETALAAAANLAATGAVDASLQTTNALLASIAASVANIQVQSTTNNYYGDSSSTTRTASGAKYVNPAALANREVTYAKDVKSALVAKGAAFAEGGLITSEGLAWVGEEEEVIAPTSKLASADDVKYYSDVLWSEAYRDNIVIHQPDSTFQSSAKSGNVPAFYDEDIPVNMFTNKSAAEALGIDKEVQALQYKRSGNSMVKPSADLINPKVVEYAAATDEATAATERYADVTDETFRYYLLMNDAIVEKTAEDGMYCEATGEARILMEEQNRLAERNIRYQKSIVGIPTEYYQAAKAYYAGEDYEQYLPEGDSSTSDVANTNKRVVTATDANTQSLQQLVAGNSNLYVALGAFGQAIYANTSALGSTAAVYANTAKTDKEETVMAWQGVQAAAGKGLMTEFDSYEYGWNTCLSYMTDQAVIAEADPSRWKQSYSGPTSSWAGPGKGAVAGKESDNYYYDYPNEQPWIEEEKRRGIGPYASSESDSDKETADNTAKTAENTAATRDGVMAWGSRSDTWFDDAAGMDGGGAWVGHYATAGTTGAGQTTWGGAAASDAILAAQKAGTIGGTLGQGTVNWGSLGDDVSDIRTWQSYLSGAERNTAEGNSIANRVHGMVVSVADLQRGTLDASTGTKAATEAISTNTEISRTAQAGLITVGVGSYVVSAVQAIASANGGGSSGGGGYTISSGGFEYSSEGSAYMPSGWTTPGTGWEGYSGAQLSAELPAGWASGGIPRSKQLAWVAEDGPEAVIPLDGSRPDLVDYVLDEYGVQRYAEGAIIGRQYLAQSGSGALSLSASQTWANGQLSQSSSMSGGTPITEEEISEKMATIEDTVSAAIANFKMAMPSTVSALVERVLQKLSEAMGGSENISITMPPIYVGAGASVTKAEIQELMDAAWKAYRSEIASILKERRRLRS